LASETFLASSVPYFFETMCINSANVQNHRSLMQVTCATCSGDYSRG